ncbi:hypothetical protein CVT26_014830 [Gymnopilus dilepis]|uniref:Uncharacterized protein n=1 Tax=Gymnopilus dilepis TaxID=231916 RepID=A0A409YXM8_9AGAR|nr:hypothetical protein CVT26_014830 [Gymnopilus dilepis]
MQLYGYRGAIPAAPDTVLTQLIFVTAVASIVKAFTHPEATAAAVLRSDKYAARAINTLTTSSLMAVASILFLS